MTTLSVIIPTLNEANHLPRLLLSLRRQRGIDFEVIIADGGSTDGTAAVAQQCAGKLPLRVLKLPRGTARQRNMASKQAAAPLLLFLDADMHIERPDFLYAIAAELTTPNVAGVTADMHVLPSMQTRADRAFAASINMAIRAGNALQIGGWMRGGCFACRKSDLDAVGGFSTKFSCGEDNECASRLSRRGRIRVLRHHTIHEHPRRYREWGYTRVLIDWIKNGAWWALFGKSHSRTWERVG